MERLEGENGSTAAIFLSALARDEDPELVKELYNRIFDLAKDFAGTVQIVLVDSHLVEPEKPQFSFSHRRMLPPLISHASYSVLKAG